MNAFFFSRHVLLKLVEVDSLVVLVSRMMLRLGFGFGFDVREAEQVGLQGPNQILYS